MEPVNILVWLIEDLEELSDSQLDTALQQIAVYSIAALRGLNGDRYLAAFLETVEQAKEEVVVISNSIEH